MARILLVDDEPDILSVLAEVFAAEGYEVDTAESGEEALEKVRARRPDLMLLDVRMPGKKGGPQTLKQVKRLYPETEVVMLTAVHDRDMVREALALGASEYITKPFDLDHLKAVIRAQVNATAAEA